MKQTRQYTHGSSALKIMRASYLEEYSNQGAELITFRAAKEQNKYDYFAFLSNISERELYIITALLCSIIAFSIFIFDFQSHQLSASLDQAPAKMITVKSGDTLWSIAQSSKPDTMNTSDMVNYLIKSNQLSSSSLAVGQSLQVPDVNAQ